MYNTSVLKATTKCDRIINKKGVNANVIVYYKLGEILKERNMNWKDLCESGISANMPQKFSQNKTVTTETIDKVCAYLKIQPGDIMEWVDEKEQEKVEIQRQIEALQKKLDNLE